MCTGICFYIYHTRLCDASFDTVESVVIVAQILIRETGNRGGTGDRIKHSNELIDCGTQVEDRILTTVLKIPVKIPTLCVWPC